MDNDSVVEQIVRNLSFEVEAIPQDNVIHLSTTTKSAPLNVKIRVRKKEEADFQHGVLSLPKRDRPDNIPERIRLASSDQTIMSFNLVMEADFFQKPVKKPRKNIMGIFKPSVCLGAEPDEDDYAYMPSNSYTAHMNKESTSKSEGALTKFTLSKNVDNDETSTKLPKRNKDIFGKCKPGGCLDPPFGEDRQPYVPAKVDEQTTPCENVINGQTAGPTVENKARTSSIFSNKFFKWKRINTKEEALDDNVITKETKAESVIDLYQAGSLQISATYSNSIMTYPTSLNSSEQLRIKEEKQLGSRTYNDSSRNSFNVRSGSYYIIPRTPQNVLDRNYKAKMVKDGDLKVDTTHETSAVLSADKNNMRDLEDDKFKKYLEMKDSSITADVNITNKDLVHPSEPKNNNDFIHDNTSVDRNNITNQQELEDNETKQALKTKDSLTTDANNNHDKASVDQNNITKQLDLEDYETKQALKTKDSHTTDANIIEINTMNPLKSKNNKYFIHDKTSVDRNNITNQQELEDNESKRAFKPEYSPTTDATNNHDNTSVDRNNITNQQDLENNETKQALKTKDSPTTDANNNHDKTSVDQNNISKEQDLEDVKTKQILKTKASPTTHANITEINSMNPLKSKNYQDFNHDKTSVDRNNITKQKNLEDDDTKQALKTKDSPTTDANNNHDKTSVDRNNITMQQVLEDDKTKQALKTKDSPTTDANNNHDKTSVDQNNITKQLDLEDDVTKQALKTKDSPTTDVNITEIDSMNLLKSMNNKGSNHDKTSVNRNNISMQQDLEDDETKQALKTKDAPTTDANNNHAKTSVDRNNITKQQVLEDDKTKHAFKTRDSPKTDVNITEKHLLSFSESKNNHDLADAPITIYNTLLTQIEPIKSKNITTQRQDELVVPNLNYISDSVIEKQISNDGSESGAIKKNELEHNVEADIEKDETFIDEILLVTTVADHLKSVAVEEPTFESQQLTDIEIENIQQTQVVKENKSGDESVVTIDAKREIAVYDITGAFEDSPDTEPTLSIERKSSVEGLKEEGLLAILTPIKRDTPLELINADYDDLQQIWKNKTNPLTSGTKINTDTQLNKQDHIMLDLLNNKINTFDEISEQESFGQTETQTVLSENNLNELIQSNYETVTQNEIQSKISQTTGIDPLENKVKLNVSLAHNNPATFENIYEIVSDTSQKLEDISFVSLTSTTSVVAEFENNKDIMDFSHAKTLEQEKTAAEQIQSEAVSYKDPDIKIISNDNDANVQGDSIYELDKNKDKSKFIKYETDLPSKQHLLQIVDTTNTTKAIADQNEADGKHILLDKELEVAKSGSIIHSDQEYKLNLNSKPDSQRTESVSKITNEHTRSSRQTQASEITSKDNARSILLNITIQSYVDNDNQVIVKNFDTNIVPERHSQDSSRVTKRCLEADDEIQIPIDTENDLYIQIKSNKQRFITGMEGNNTGEATSKQWVGNKYESELEHIKRNVTIAEDIRKTLEAVYEKELLPLRSTITELRENMEVLKMHYMALKGHMFVKKPKSTKLVPLYRKCGCMKK